MSRIRDLAVPFISIRSMPSLVALDGAGGCVSIGYADLGMEGIRIKKGLYMLNFNDYFMFYLQSQLTCLQDADLDTAVCPMACETFAANLARHPRTMAAEMRSQENGACEVHVQSAKDLIACPFDGKGFPVGEHGLVFLSEPVGLYLQGIGVDLTFPKPVGAAKLDVAGVKGRKDGQGFYELFSSGRVVNAQGKVGDAVLHGFHRGNGRKGHKVLRVPPTGKQEVAVAALEGKAAGQSVKIGDDPAQGRIDHGFGEASQGTPPLLGKIRVGHKWSGGCEGLHGHGSFLVGQCVSPDEWKKGYTKSWAANKAQRIC